MVFDIHALSQQDFTTWLEEAKASAQPPGAPESLPPNSTVLDLTAEGVKFDKVQLEAPAGQPFGINFSNNDNGIPHDVAISGEGGLLFNGEDVPTVGEIQYVVPPLDQGEYQFLCTIHPQQMTGTLTVK
jgi:plastocyanin